PESTPKVGPAIKSWTSSASPMLSTSPAYSPRPTATSRGPDKPSATSSGNSSSANSASALRKNWAPSLTSAHFTMRCSTAEPSLSISSTHARTNGSHNKNQSDVLGNSSKETSGCVHSPAVSYVRHVVNKLSN